MGTGIYPGGTNTALSLCTESVSDISVVDTKLASPEHKPSTAFKGKEMVPETPGIPTCTSGPSNATDPVDVSFLRHTETFDVGVWHDSIVVLVCSREIDERELVDPTAGVHALRDFLCMGPTFLLLPGGLHGDFLSKNSSPKCFLS